jgi:hypothetical protein
MACEELNHNKIHVRPSGLVGVTPQRSDLLGYAPYMLILDVQINTRFELATKFQLDQVFS